MRAAIDDPRFQVARHAMVQEQLRARGIRDENVLAAMERIPRQEFIARPFWNDAYGDHPVPLASGQSVSQPYMVASMLQALDLRRDCRVLEIGTGTGYQAALLAEISEFVVSIERVEELALAARENFKRLGIENIEVVYGDGSMGYPPRAPYDRIIVAAAAPAVPAPLVEQLKDGGVLLIPIGAADVQVVHRITRNGTETSTDLLESCRFVPLIGNQGYQRE
jgi:protein-L-isoaspartate(D-aspartate) O-methyltransferase